MALFKTDPNKKIADTETNINRLKTDLAEAENAVERYRATAIKLNTDGNDKAGVEQAKLAWRSAQENVDTNQASIADEEQNLASLITARDKVADTKTRHETANEIEAELRKSGDIQRDLNSVLKRLAAFAEWCAPFTPEAQGLLNYTIASRSQIPEALTLLQKLIGYHAQAVMAGTAPASLKRMTAPFVEPVETAPVMTTVFAIKSIKWTDPVDGTARITQRFKDVSMPPAFAKAALDNNVAVRLDDPRCKDRNSVGGNPEPLHAFDLDEAMAEKSTAPKLVEPIRQSNPQFIETIGPPKRVSMS